MTTSSKQQESRFLLEAFKTDYIKYGPENLAVQIPHLEKLADVYIQTARVTADPREKWMNYVKAHCLINACLARDDDLNKWQPKRYSIECEYHGYPLTLSTDMHLAITRQLKNELDRLRKDIREKLEPVTARVHQLDIDNDSNLENIEILNFLSEVSFGAGEYCTEGMKQLCAEVIKASELIVGKPPCSYCAVALGSMARGEATPYSDLEYLFIVESTEHNEYFTRLAVDSYFRINNFAETPLKCMYFQEIHTNYGESNEKNWFIDKSMNGFKIDGFTPRAGNVPTGNPTTGKYLIKTPQQLAEMHLAALQSEHLLTGESDLLSSTTLFHSHNHGEELYNKFLELKHLPVAEKNTGTLKNQVSNFLKDLASYKFIPDVNAGQDQKRSVKADIYRYPSLLLNNLRNLFNCESVTTRALLYELKETGILSPELTKDLTQLTASALYVRMTAYLTFHSQKEELSFLTSSVTVPCDKYYFPRELFIIMAVIMSKLKNPTTYESDRLRKAEAIYFCEDYARYLTEIADILNLLNLEDAARTFRATEQFSTSRNILLMIGFALNMTTDYQTSNSYYKELLKLEQTKENISWLHIKIGKNHKNMAQYDEAKQQFDSALTSISIIGTEGVATQRLTAEVHEAIANIQLHQSEFDSAIDHCNKSLKVMNTLCGDGNASPEIAHIYHSLGSAYVNKADAQMALKHYQTSLDMKRRIYGPESNHTSIAASLHELGNTYNLLGKYDEAYEYYNKALNMFKDIYGKSSTDLSIASSHFALGNMHYKKHQYNLALADYHKSLEITKQVFPYNHPEISTILQQIGLTYHDSGRKDLAKQYWMQSLEINKIIYGDKASHADIALSLHSLGMLYAEAGEYTTATDYLKEASHMTSKVYGDRSCHPYIAASHHVLGQMYEKQGRLRDSTAELLKAVAMMECTFGYGNSHPDLQEYRRSQWRVAQNILLSFQSLGHI